jgi:ABC-type transporter Mla subunit MlaD
MLPDSRQVLLARNDINKVRRSMMDFSEKLDELKAKVDEMVATTRAAAEENRDQLKQRVDQAQVNAKLAMEDAKQKTDETAERAKSKWAQMKADAAAKREDVKAKIEKRADQVDAKVAANDADWAEQDAADAIDYAGWMVYEAELTVLDALDARAYADERAKIAAT